MSEDSYVVESVVRGYHVYKEIWNAIVGRLSCQQETGTPHNLYTVAVMERDVIVVHVPWEISTVCSLFLGRHGSILCEVRHYSTDLPQGGLEIPR